MTSPVGGLSIQPQWLRSTMPSFQKQSVLGIGISPTSYDEVAEACRAWIAKPDPGGNRYICVTSVHGIMTAVFDTAVRDHLNRAAIATPDGMPVVWALRSFGYRCQ